MGPKKVFRQLSILDMFAAKTGSPGQRPPQPAQAEGATPVPAPGPAPSEGSSVLAKTEAKKGEAAGTPAVHETAAVVKAAVGTADVTATEALTEKELFVPAAIEEQPPLAPPAQAQEEAVEADEEEKCSEVLAPASVDSSSSSASQETAEESDEDVPEELQLQTVFDKYISNEEAFLKDFGLEKAKSVELLCKIRDEERLYGRVPGETEQGRLTYMKHLIRAEYFPVGTRFKSNYKLYNAFSKMQEKAMDYGGTHCGNLHIQHFTKVGKQLVAEVSDVVNGRRPKTALPGMMDNALQLFKCLFEDDYWAADNEASDTKLGFPFTQLDLAVKALLRNFTDAELGLVGADSRNYLQKAITAKFKKLAKDLKKQSRSHLVLEKHFLADAAALEKLKKSEATEAAVPTTAAEQKAPASSTAAASAKEVEKLRTTCMNKLISAVNKTKVKTKRANPKVEATVACPSEAIVKALVGADGGVVKTDKPASFVAHLNVKTVFPEMPDELQMKYCGPQLVHASYRGPINPLPTPCVFQELILSYKKKDGIITFKAKMDQEEKKRFEAMLAGIRAERQPEAGQ